MPNINIQRVSKCTNLPTDAQLQYWVNATIRELPEQYKLVIRIVDAEEISELNQQYRFKSGATNVLSFPFEAPEYLQLNLIGDLVVCASVIEAEAKTQAKDLWEHWAHIIIHGILHLLGYDHQNNVDSEIMEAKEILLLKTININNPYEEM